MLIWKMTIEKLEKLKSEFETEVWVWLYEALNLWFWNYDCEYYAYNDESAIRLDEGWFTEIVNQLKTLCLERISSKETLEAKHIKCFAKVSDEKCFNPEKARYSRMYTAIKPFLDEEKIKNNLSRNATLCFNPYMILNYPDINCPLIFTPSKELLEQYRFIKKKYSWTSRVVLYYYIDMEEYKSFRSWDIVVEPADMLELNLRYLHPFHRWAIQNDNFYLLKSREDDIK